MSQQLRFDYRATLSQRNECDPDLAEEWVGQSYNTSFQHIRVLIKSRFHFLR